MQEKNKHIFTLPHFHIKKSVELLRMSKKKRNFAAKME